MDHILQLGFIFISCLIAVSDGYIWSYKGPTGPDHWQEYSAICQDGKSQSPVNVNVFETVYDENLSPIKFSAAYNQTQAGGQLVLKNNGYTVLMTPTNGDFTITEGGLPGIFRLVQFHFHWGSVDDEGSEHAINGEKYPVEVHFVHFNIRYPDIAEALKHKDGMAVVSVLFKTCGREDNLGLKPVTDELKNVLTVGTKTSINSLSVYNILGKDFNFKNFYRYSGSLSTPGCAEIVTWTVYHSLLHISCKQLAQLRNMRSTDGSKLVDNFRPLQHLYKRKISRSFEKKCTPQTKSRHRWTYFGQLGPKSWKQHFETCNGRRQSPVNIVTSRAAIDKDLVPFKLSPGYRTVPGGRWPLENNGHTVKILADTGVYTITGGNTPSLYRLAEFSFHWGLSDERGSEHSFNGEYYPMEMQMVHFNSKYSDLKEAQKHSDGLAILAFMFQINGDKTNMNLNPIVEKLHSIMKPGTSVPLRPLNLLQLMGGINNLNRYYRYHGSLTAPHCSEAALWTIYETPLTISDQQLASFRKLIGYEKKKLGDNARPVQPLFGRNIKRSNFNVVLKRSSVVITPKKPAPSLKGPATRSVEVKLKPLRSSANLFSVYCNLAVVLSGLSSLYAMRSA